jgi:Cu2+-exporting ATPase
MVYVRIGNSLAGLIYFEDQVRDDARLVVESLSKLGMNVFMLSGDKKNAAEYVASLVGIPKEKVPKFKLKYQYSNFLFFKSFFV